MINVNEQIKYWEKSAKENLDAAEVLFKNKHYDSCLFFCHLALEKLLKAAVIKATKKHPPLIHDLARLANFAKLNLESGQVNYLRIITTFNISGRYSEIKYSFYKKVDKTYSHNYLVITKKLFIWLKKEFQKK
jgi:HEPN domain-containing protein